MMILLTLFFLVVAYLIGSISSAIIVCKLMGLTDPRSQGSGNPGATNVLRIAGKKAAILTLLGDVLKGVIPVLLAKAAGVSGVGLALVALAAFLGHLYPIYFGFRGGKGVATGFGVIIALSWPLGFACALTWLLMAVVFRYSSLAALTTAILAPFYSFFLANQHYLIPLIAMSLLLILRHSKNIKKLLSGMESKIGAKK